MEEKDGKVRQVCVRVHSPNGEGLEGKEERVSEGVVNPTWGPGSEKCTELVHNPQSSLGS